MIKKILLPIAFALCVLIVYGQTKVSPYTQSYLRKQSSEKVARTSTTKQKSIFPKTVTRGTSQFVDAFITLNEGADEQFLVDQGVTIYTKMDNLLTAKIPVDKITSISQLEQVKRVSIAKPARLKNDKARVTTKVAQAHEGTGLTQTYTGRGVVVGGVDAGIDVNHIAFTNEAGQSRVKRVYFPGVRSGTPPSGIGVDGNSFPGSEYTTPSAIAKLTTDYDGDSHGSHTFGIAAGGYKGNGYYGMAPEADIVMVGDPELTDVTIANGVSYAFNYANNENKPAVVNLSLGVNVGPHDGTTEMNRYFDQLAATGNIIVVSAGNEGGDQLHLSKTFSSSTDQLKTFLIDYQDGSRYFQGYVDAWSKNTTAVGIQVVVYNTTSNAIVYQSRVFKPGAAGDTFEVNSGTDTNFAKYYDGYVYFWSGVEHNNRYNVWCEFEANIPTYETTTAQPKYRLGLIYTSAANNSIDVWSDDYNTYLSGEGISGWTDGNATFSINDFATTNSVISVGAYSSRDKYQTINGQNESYNELTLNDIAPFSSYGVDFNGISRPDVAGPGFFVLSAVNSYDKETTVSNRTYLAAEITSGGRKHHWGDMAGTSMSSPAVAGIVALWLQADPTLDVAKVREIIQATSIKDSYVLSGNPVRWGAGKIDALAGLISVIKSGTKGVISENNAVLIYPNPSNGQFKVLAQGETSTMTLNVYATNGTLVATQALDAAQGEIDVDLSSQLSTGLYIVQLIGEKVNHTSRLIIK